MVDIRQLTYFVGVIDNGGFTAASRALNVAQSALSHNLQSLEYEFGKALLVRHSRGIKPTDAGLRLLDHARGILAAVDTARSDVRGFHEEPVRTIRLGLPRSLCALLDDRFVSDWSAHYPKIRLQVSEQASSVAVRQLADSLLDMAVTASPVEASTMVSEGLLQEHLCAVVPAELGPSFEPIRLAELAELGLILYTLPYVGRRLVESAARYNSIDLSVVHEINSVDLSLKLVEAGAGATVQPYLSLVHYNGPALIRPIVAPNIVRRLSLVTPRFAQPHAEDEEFRAYFREALNAKLSRLQSRGLLELE